MLAPDGAAIYTSDGRMMGISYNGRITGTGNFGLALKKLAAMKKLIYIAATAAMLLMSACYGNDSRARAS